METLVIWDPSRSSWRHCNCFLVTTSPFLKVHSMTHETCLHSCKNHQWYAINILNLSGPKVDATSHTGICRRGCWMKTPEIRENHLWKLFSGLPLQYKDRLSIYRTSLYRLDGHEAVLSGKLTVIVLLMFYKCRNKYIAFKACVT